MGVKNYIPERDGSLAGLLLLEMMACRNKNILEILRDTEKKFGRYYYVRQDLKLKSRPAISRDACRPSCLAVRWSRSRITTGSR